MAHVRPGHFRQNRRVTTCHTLSRSSAFLRSLRVSKRAVLRQLICPLRSRPRSGCFSGGSVIPCSSSSASSTSSRRTWSVSQSRPPPSLGCVSLNGPPLDDQRPCIAEYLLVVVGRLQRRKVGVLPPHRGLRRRLFCSGLMNRLRPRLNHRGMDRRRHDRPRSPGVRPAAGPPPPARCPTDACAPPCPARRGPPQPPAADLPAPRCACAAAPQQSRRPPATHAPAPGAPAGSAARSWRSPSPSAGRSPAPCAAPL